MDGRRFHEIEEIGTGPWGPVFRARDEETGDEVDLHVPLRSSGDGPNGLVERARRMVGRTHPGWIPVLGVETTGGTPAVAVEAVRGPHAARVLHEAAPLSLRGTVLLGRRLALALARAHEEGLVHGALGTRRIVLESWSASEPEAIRPRILGIGLRCPPDEETPSGAPGEAGSPAADVRAVGFILLRALVGPSVGEGAVRDLGDERPGLPADLTRLVRRCLAFDPGDRPGMDEVARVLGSLEEGLPDRGSDREKTSSSLWVPGRDEEESVDEPPVAAAAGTDASGPPTTLPARVEVTRPTEQDETPGAEPTRGEPEQPEESPGVSVGPAGGGAPGPDRSRTRIPLRTLVGGVALGGLAYLLLPVLGPLLTPSPSPRDLARAPEAASEEAPPGDEVEEEPDRSDGRTPEEPAGSREGSPSDGDDLTRLPGEMPAGEEASADEDDAGAPSESSPDGVESVVARALMLADAGDLDGARNEVRAGLRRHPGDERLAEVRNELWDRAEEEAGSQDRSGTTGSSGEESAPRTARSDADSTPASTGSADEANGRATEVSSRAPAGSSTDGPVEIRAGEVRGSFWAVQLVTYRMGDRERARNLVDRLDERGQPDPFVWLHDGWRSVCVGRFRSADRARSLRDACRRLEMDGRAAFEDAFVVRIR